MNADEHRFRLSPFGSNQQSPGISAARDAPRSPSERSSTIVAVLDADPSVRQRIADALQHLNLTLELFSDPTEFLLRSFPAIPLCLVTNVASETMSGLEIQELLKRGRWHTSVVFLAKDADLPLAIRAMQEGATDVLTEPLETHRLVEAVSLAISSAHTRCTREQSITEFEQRVRKLSKREGEVMMLVTRGLLNKQIAATLGISLITAKLHRGRMMKKLRSPRLPELVRMVDALTHAGVTLPQTFADEAVDMEEALST